MKDRILYLRKTALKLSRAKFGEPVGMSDSEIKNLENGITQLKDSKISLICRTYGVNEKWLRTGEGEIFPPKSRGDEISEIVKAASENDPETAEKFFTSLLSDMSDAEIVLMYEIFKRHFGTGEKDKG